MAQEQENNNSITHKERQTNSLRTLRFLKPCTTHLNKAVPVPNNPLLSEIFPQNLPEWPSKVLFKGWKFPQRKWKQWVNRLSRKYSVVWKETGIYNAIMSSLYIVPRNEDLVLGLCEFWSPETNTFVFPWGEATITLEDIMILGCFPVIGENVNIPLNEETKKMERVLEKDWAKIKGSKANKIDQLSWLKHFMSKKDEVEHVAFLSLWLSRYVFTSLADYVGKHIVPIAIKLSRGTKVALAPAVLARIYHNLRVIRDEVLESKETILVSGQFHLLQLWVFEHFSLLGPKLPSLIKVGEPRVARWHNLNSKVSLPLIRLALRVEGNFDWRPYAANLENWCHLSCYRETKQTLLFNESGLDVELRSFFLCLRACELVGVDCKEDYFPHRVAMQFGLDQDLPSDPKDFNFNSKNAKFFVPPKDLRSCASNRYATWWKNMMMTRTKELEDILKEAKYASIIKECHGSVASNDSSDTDVIPTSFCMKNWTDKNVSASSKELIVSDSSGMDGITTSFLAKLGSPKNDMHLNSAKVKETSGKRSSGDGDERTGTAKTVKTGVCVSDNEPIDLDKLENEVEPTMKGCKSGKDVEKKGKKAGDTSENPIDIDDLIEPSARNPQNPTQGTEERLAKLENVIRLLTRRKSTKEEPKEVS